MKRRLLCLVLLCVLLSQATVTLGLDAPLVEYQARAASYYEAGVDENALLGNAWNTSGDIRPGMVAPDFTVMDLDGVSHTLSDRRGQRFVLLEIGNAT